MKKILLLTASHAAMLAVGFALGVYFLPILIAPPGPSQEQVAQTASGAKYQTTFKRDLEGSDAFHWGEGELAIGAAQVSFMGELSPGPDYKLYLAPRFVATEAEFNAIKAQSARVGDIKTFENFILDLPATVNPDEYTTAVVWCETFGEFITAGRYR